MKHLFTLLLFSLLVNTFIFGQEDTRNPISKFLTKRGYTFPDSTNKNTKADLKNQWPDTLYYNTLYKSRLMGSITIPFFFSNVEIEGGRITVTPAVNLGLGYTWFWGDFIFNESDKITIDPEIYFGLFANTGVENGLGLKSGGLIAAGFVGVSAFTLIFGYDIINKSPSIGIGGRIDFYTISQNFLHVFGKIHEIRKHKSIARPITGE
jgi:hypothetical protein